MDGALAHVSRRSRRGRSPGDSPWMETHSPRKVIQLSVPTLVIHTYTQYASYICIACTQYILGFCVSASVSNTCDLIGRSHGRARAGNRRRAPRARITSTSSSPSPPFSRWPPSLHSALKRTVTSRRLLHAAQSCLWVCHNIHQCCPVF